MASYKTYFDSDILILYFRQTMENTLEVVGHLTNNVQGPILLCIIPDFYASKLDISGNYQEICDKDCKN